MHMDVFSSVSTSYGNDMHCPVAVDNHSLELSHPNMASLEVQEILFSRKHSIRMEHVEFRVCEYEKNRLGVCVKHHLPEVRSALAKRKLRENRFLLAVMFTQLA